MEDHASSMIQLAAIGLHTSFKLHQYKTELEFDSTQLCGFRTAQAHPTDTRIYLHKNAFIFMAKTQGIIIAKTWGIITRQIAL